MEAACFNRATGSSPLLPYPTACQRGKPAAGMGWGEQSPCVKTPCDLPPSLPAAYGGRHGGTGTYGRHQEQQRPQWVPVRQLPALPGERVPWLKARGRPIGLYFHDSPCGRNPWLKISERPKGRVGPIGRVPRLTAGPWPRHPWVENPCSGMRTGQFPWPPGSQARKTNPALLGLHAGRGQPRREGVDRPGSYYRRRPEPLKQFPGGSVFPNWRPGGAR